jgi:hypothetical protein
MKKSEPRQISVFIASPGDLAPERKVFKDTIDDLNSGFADGAGVKFVPIGWEDVLAETGRRTQGVINRELDECDLFVLALHRRWGQDAPDSKFSSYTEEEFELAYKLWRMKKSPEVLVFFKTVDNASVADPGPELKKVLEFRKKLEEGHAILIRPFNTDVDFGKEIDRHLRAFARDEWQALDAPSPEIKFSQAQEEALTKAERVAEQRVERAQKRKASFEEGTKGKKKNVVATADLSLVKSFQTDLALARAAVDAARDGRTQDARILFAKATEGTTDLSILAVAADFFRKVGDLDNASRLVQRQAAIARDRRIAVEHYLALVPHGFLSTMQEQTLTFMLSQFPPEVADEIRSINLEVFGGGRLERMLADMIVKHYTASEILELARFLASPVGQSSLQKQPAMMAEMMALGQSEFNRVLLKRHPELAGTDEMLSDASAAALPAVALPNQLTAGSPQGADERTKPN